MRIWISWERQRRSIELAKKFGCELHIFEHLGIMRYPLSILNTILVLFKNRPQIAFFQNPSMVLAALACLYGAITKTIVIVDRHSTFRLKKPHSGSCRIWLFMRLHYYTLKYADLTIVTNKYLANLVQEAGGHPFVLPDMLPRIEMCNTKKLKNSINLLMISSFGLDEPISEVINAMGKFNGENICLYITGNYKKKDPKLPEKSPANVFFTGFVPDQEFIEILFSVDIVLVFTTSEYCMLCGCYEAVAAEKPLITSDKSVLKDYFKDAVFVENTSENIEQGIRLILENMQLYTRKSKKMKKYLNLSWTKLYNQLETTIEKIQL